MKIVVTGTRGIPGIQGGIETHCEELYPLIADRQHEVIVVRRPGYSANRAVKVYRLVTIKDIGVVRNKYLEAFVHTFLAILYARRTGADIVHIHAVGPALFTPLARMLGLKVVVTHHGADYDREKWGGFAKWILRMGEKAGMRYANHVIVISEHIRRRIWQRYPSMKNITLVHNGVKAFSGTCGMEFIHGLGLTERNYVLAVGRLVKEKGFDRLVEAFGQLPASSLTLVIAGGADHEDSYALKLREKCGKVRNVCLAGFVKGDDLTELYAHARLFVLPSTHEGLPIALLEAMSCGVPVLASDIPANKEIGLPDECYFRSGDTDDLRKALEQRMAERQDGRVEYDLSAYDWGYIALRTKSIYDSLME